MASEVASSAANGDEPAGTMPGSRVVERVVYVYSDKHSLVQDTLKSGGAVYTLPARVRAASVHVTSLGRGNTAEFVVQAPPTTDSLFGGAVGAAVTVITSDHGMVELRRGTLIGGSPHHPILINDGGRAKPILAHTQSLCLPPPADGRERLWGPGGRVDILDHSAPALVSYELADGKWHWQYRLVVGMDNRPLSTLLRARLSFHGPPVAQDAAVPARLVLVAGPLHSRPTGEAPLARPKYYETRAVRAGSDDGGPRSGGLIESYELPNQVALDFGGAAQLGLLADQPDGMKLALVYAHEPAVSADDIGNYVLLTNTGAAASPPGLLVATQLQHTGAHTQLGASQVPRTLPGASKTARLGPLTDVAVDRRVSAGNWKEDTAEAARGHKVKRDSVTLEFTNFRSGSEQTGVSGVVDVQVWERVPRALRVSFEGEREWTKAPWSDDAEDYDVWMSTYTIEPSTRPVRHTYDIVIKQ